MAGKDIKDTQGEEDIVKVMDASEWNTSESCQQIPFFIYTDPPQSAAINATISNIMLNTGDKPLPYIDSDELKATGGVVIHKARIVALVLSEERRVAA